MLPDQFPGQRIQPALVATGVDDTILDVLPLQPAKFLHALLEGRVQIGDSGFRSQRQPTETTDRRGRLSAAVSVRHEQADATCQ